MPNAALRPLLRIDADIGPMTPTGATPAGEIVLVPILGGSFEGDDVRGEVLSGGADWQDVRWDRAPAQEAGSSSPAQGAGSSSPAQGAGSSSPAQGAGGRALEISARYLLQSDLRELIEVRSDGLLAATPAVRERKARGEHPSIHEYYWRTSLRFRTASARLARWNDILAVADLEMRTRDAGLCVHLNVYEVL